MSKFLKLEDFMELSDAGYEEAIVQFLHEEAENLGLGTCWVAWFTQEEIRPILNIPPDKYVVSIITLGYANKIPKARPRKKLEEIIHLEVW